MKEKIKIGIIGLGQRGDIMLENPIIPMMKDGAGIEIIAVCDRLPDRVSAAAENWKRRAFRAQPSLRIIKNCLKLRNLTRCI